MRIASVALKETVPAPPAVGADAAVRVVVANAARARILRPSREGGLKELASMANPAAQAGASHGCEEVVVGRLGPGRRAADEFARALCRQLARAGTDAAAMRIYLMAEASFLERLRAHVDAVTHAHIVREIAGDYTGHSAGFIRDLLPRRL